MKRLVVFLLALALAGWGSAHAQPQPDSAASQARIAAQNAFSQQPDGAAWAIRRHEITKVPVSIFDGPSRGPALKGASPEAKAEGFFARHKKMFGYRPVADELEVASVKERRDFIYVQLTQKYEDVPVHRGGYKIKMTREGELRMISGRFFPDIDLDVTPGLSASRAGEIAAGAIPADSLTKEPDADLVVYPGEGRYALAYEVHLAGSPAPQSWRVFVDAQTGDVLKKENVTQYLASARARPSSAPASTSPPPVSPLPTTGSGKVYLDDPNDGSTATEDLPRLSGDGSSLTGTYAEAHNYDGSDASPTSSPATYYFSSSNVHFDEVNLYYHVDRYADHLPSIGYAGLGRTIEAYAHWTGCYSGSNCNSAFYDADSSEGNGKQLYFGDGDGEIFRDFAKDNDVIYHEYNHAVLDELDIGYNTYPEETGALQEGTADYLAASFEGEPRIGEWVTVCSNTGDLRTVSSSASTFDYSNKSSVEYAYCSTEDKHLNEDETRYAVGMIWSGALWDLRNVLGGGTTDELVIETFNSLSDEPDFHQARDALVQADQDFNNGSNTCDIKGSLANRGIGDVPVYISGPNELDAGEEGTWTADVWCNGGSLSYQWYDKYEADDSFSAIDGATSSSYTASYYGDVTLKVKVTTNEYTNSDTHSVSVNCDRTCTASIEETRVQKGTGDDVSDAQTKRRRAGRPDAFALEGSTPNPVRSRATIRYALPEATGVTLTVYDVMGRRVATLARGQKPAGVYDATLQAADLPSGIYLYRLQAGSFTETKRLVVVK